MALDDLSEAYRKVVSECLHASANGPFFADWEFHTLFGLERSRVAEIASRWPDVDDSDDDVRLAINNAMNNLLGYPHGLESVWSDHISVGLADVARVYAKLRGEMPQGYFDGLE